MKYKIKKLDGRYAHHNYFAYCIDFPRNQFGPADFHQVMEWMIDTYGYSAEVRDFMHIRNMLQKRLQFNVPDSNNPKCVNQLWTWTNGSENLRIYLKGDKEATYFALKWPHEDS